MLKSFPTTLLIYFEQAVDKSGKAQLRRAVNDDPLCALVFKVTLPLHAPP
jgi:hypothetical protein